MTLSDRERRVLAHIETQLRLHRPSPLWRLYGLFLMRRYRRTMPYLYRYRPPRRDRYPYPRARFRPRPGFVARHGARIIAVLVVALAVAVGVIIGLSLAG